MYSKIGNDFEIKIGKEEIMKKKRNLSIFAILVAVVFAFGGGLLLNSSPVSNIALTSATAVASEETKVENATMPKDEAYKMARFKTKKISRLFKENNY